MQTPDPKQVASSLKMSQIIQLVKDNQLVTALVVFLLWQVGAIAQGVEIVGGVC